VAPVPGVDDQPRRDRTAALLVAGIHLLARFLIGRSLVEVSVALRVDDDRSRLGALGKAHLRAFVGQHPRRHPPRLIEHVSRGAQTHRDANRLPGVAGVGRGPLGAGRAPPRKLFAHVFVPGEAPCGQQDSVTGSHADVVAARLHDCTGDAPVLDDEVCQRGVRPYRHVSSQQRVEQSRTEGGPVGHEFLPAKAAQRGAQPCPSDDGQPNPGPHQVQRRCFAGIEVDAVRESHPDLVLPAPQLLLVEDLRFN
jgi:hypothetical protein